MRNFELSPDAKEGIYCALVFFGPASIYLLFGSSIGYYALLFFLTGVTVYTAVVPDNLQERLCGLFAIVFVAAMIWGATR